MEVTQPKRQDLIPVDGTPAWRSRGLTEESCTKWKLGVGHYSGETVRIFRYTKDGATVAQKVRPVSKDGIRFLGDKDVDLYGRSLWGTGGKMVVITEGEIDAVSISQVHSHKWPVVSIPNGSTGARKALQKHLEWLNTFETVVLWFDDDDPGRKAVEECAPLFAPGTCKVAKLAPFNDPNEALQAGKHAEITKAIFQAEVWRPDGIVSGDDLWETLSRPQEISPIKWPWEGVQETTLGLRPTEVVTITAGSGIGKSAVVREVAHHLLSQGETVGMMMFEETVRRTALGLMSIDMNLNLLHELNPEKEVGYAEAYRQTVGCGRLFLYDHFGSTALDNVLSRARYMANALDCRWLVLDHLSILASGVSEAQADERRLIDFTMTALKSLAMETGLGILLVSHLRRPEGKGHEEGANTSLAQLRGSHAIAQLSDCVIGLERNQQDTENSDVTSIRILKNRFAGTTGLAGELKYDHKTGRLHERRTADFGRHADREDPIF